MVPLKMPPLKAILIGATRCGQDFHTWATGRGRKLHRYVNNRPLRMNQRVSVCRVVQNQRVEHSRIAGCRQRFAVGGQGLDNV